MLHPAQIDPAKSWALALLNTHPEWQTIRLGHGWDELNDRSVTWLDVKFNEGHHLSLDKTEPPLYPPEEVCQHIIGNTRIGSWQDFDR
jgi:hypothetical protein